MNGFYIISSLVLYGLTLICFLIPFKMGKLKTAYIVGGALGVLISWTLLVNLEFLVIFIWPLIIMFQIIFIAYWTFFAFKRRKTGLAIAIFLTIGFLLIIMQPWISDWTFNKKDAAKVLSFHDIVLEDDFKIVEYEAGGFRDYYEIFTLKLSNSDFKKISQKIKTSKYYKGFFVNDSLAPSPSYKSVDTIDFETYHQFSREYWTSSKMENGTFHFVIELKKSTKELVYIGSDE